MKKFLFETHAHTSETSPCGTVNAKTVVEHYRELGYNGVVITDHLSADNFKRFSKSTAVEKADFFLGGYRAAKKYESEDFKVILGAEIRFTDDPSDFLIYGFNEDFLYEHELDKFRDLEEFRPFADEHSLVVFQAHPFRVNIQVQDPKLLDGMEVYNSHPNHNSSNDIALAWAEKYSLRFIAGSDYHGQNCEIPGGIYTDEPITDSCNLRDILLSGNYEVKTDKTTK